MWSMYPLMAPIFLVHYNPPSTLYIFWSLVAQWLTCSYQATGLIVPMWIIELVSPFLVSFIFFSTSSTIFSISSYDRYVIWVAWVTMWFFVARDVPSPTLFFEVLFNPARKVAWTSSKVDVSNGVFDCSSYVPLSSSYFLVIYLGSPCCCYDCSSRSSQLHSLIIGNHHAHSLVMAW